MGEKTANLGHFLIPTAPAAGTAVAQSATANTYGTKVNIGGTGLGALYVTGVYVEVIAGANLPTYVGVQLYVTATTVVDTMNVPLGPTSGVASTQWAVYKPIYPPVPVAAATQILAATASSVASAISYLITLECILQSDVVDDGVAVGTVTTVTNQLTAAQIATGVWQDATAGDFTTASSIGKSLYTGNVVPGGVGGIFIAGINAATTITTGLTATFTGNLTGSVASVTGAVGSVTGLTAANLDAAVSSRLATSGYTSPDNANIAAIKAKTDGLTFTVASQVDVNIKSVAGITISGTGTAAAPWGP